MTAVDAGQVLVDRLAVSNDNALFLILKQRQSRTHPKRLQNLHHSKRRLHGRQKNMVEAHRAGTIEQHVQRSRYAANFSRATEDAGISDG